MRKFVMSAALAASVLAAAPAMAQDWRGYPPPPPSPGGGYGWNQPGQVSVWQLRDMVEQAIQNRQVSWQEARVLRREIGYLMQIDNRYRNNGYTGYERADINRRTNDLLQRLRYDQRGGGYNNGYNNNGWNNGYNGNNGQWNRGNGYGDDRRGYDPRDRDDDDRYNGEDR